MLMKSINTHDHSNLILTVTTEGKETTVDVIFKGWVKPTKLIIGQLFQAMIDDDIPENAIVKFVQEPMMR